MLATVELDYVQHLERGYCENHPDVIAQTKEQVVDRAVKQLLEALQANGFELDGQILKRGDGWLQYDTTTSAWQYSNDTGATWQDIGSASGLPAELATPVTIGSMQIRDNGGSLQLSDDGETWYDFYAQGWDLSLSDKKFYPPKFSQAGDPSASIFAVACAFWENTADGSRWLLYKDAGGTVFRQQLFPRTATGRPFFGLHNPTFAAAVDNLPDVTASLFTIAGVFDLDFATSSGESVFYHLKNASAQTIFKFGFNHATGAIFVDLGSVHFDHYDILSYQKIAEFGVIVDPLNHQVAFFESGMCAGWESVTGSFPDLTTPGTESVGPLQGDFYWMGMAWGMYHTPGTQGMSLRRGRSQWNNAWRYWGAQEGSGAIVSAHRTTGYQNIAYTLTAGEWVGVEE